MSVSRDEVLNTIDKIKSDRDLYWLAGLIIGSNDDCLSRLFVSMSKSNLLNVICQFGGETITIPTYDDFLDYIKIISIIYYYDIKKYSFAKAMRESGYTYKQSMNQAFRKSLISRRQNIISKLKKVL